MEPDIKSPISPETPLFPLSPVAANARKRPAPDLDMPVEAQHRLSPSPSLSALPHLLQSKGHLRNSSDVQGKVAQFNGLAKEAAQRRKDNEAALKRAILGREEAEGETKRLREGNEHLRKEIEEGRGRERRLLGKAEEFKELFQRDKETHVRERDVFEREVRRSRKDAFKSSSQLVACQEELRSARNRFTLMREDMEAQKRLKEDKQAELEEARAQLAALGDDLAAFKERITIAEKEKEALKMALDAETVARAASQGSIALPSLPEDDEFASPKKRRRGNRSSSKENADPQNDASEDGEEELIALKEDLLVERRLRNKAQEEAHFLKMECQFGICSCRIAEQRGQQFIHDDQFAAKMRHGSTSVMPIADAVPAPSLAGPDPADTRPNVPIDPALAGLADPSTGSQASSERTTSSNTVIFSPNSGTFRQPSSTQEPEPSHNSNLSSGAANLVTEQISPQPSTPPRSSPPTAIPSTHAHPAQVTIPLITPRPLPNPPPRTISHTTTITTIATKPAFDDPVFSPAPNTPGGISREEALERIRARRGRARSFAVGIGGTPGRAPVRTEKEEGRVISAPVMSRR